MRPVVVLALLALSGCQATVRQHVVTPQLPPPVEEGVPSDHSNRQTPKSTVERVAPPSSESSIKSALDAVDKAQETVERRRYILDNKSDQKAAP